MARRGELVGEAYILMRADGRLLKRDMRNEAEDAAVLAGKKSGKKYAKEFDKEVKQATKMLGARFRRTLAEAAADGNFKKWHRNFDDINVAAKELRNTLNEMTRKGMLSREMRTKIEAQWKQYVEDVRTATREQKAHRVELEKQRRVAEQLAKQWRNVLPVETEKRTKRFVSLLAQSTLDADFSRMAKKGESVNETLTRLRRRIAEIAPRLRITDEEWKNVTAAMTVWEINARETQTTLKKTNVEVERTRINLGGFRRNLNLVGDATARAFGRGARNDFVNFFGAVASLPFRAITGSISLLTRGIEGAQGGWINFTDGFKASRLLGIGRVGSVFQGLLKTLGGPQGVIAALGALVAGTFAFGKVLPGVVAAVSGLVAALTALAGGIVTGISGALLALVPLLPAAVAGFGLLGKAIYDFATGDKAGEKVMKRLNKELEKTTKKLIPDIKKGFKLITDGIPKLFKPLGVSVQTIIRDFNKRVEESTKSGAFGKWADSIAVISEDLGVAFNALAQGLTEFFVPILPYAERLSGWIRQSMENFANWAGLAENKNKVAGWMDRAYEAAKNLWGILSGLVTAIGKILNSGSESEGETFLDRINGKVQELNGWLDNPENKDKLDEWFANGAEIAEDLKNIAGNIANIIKELDSPEGRRNAQEFLDTLSDIGDIAEDIAAAADAVGRLFEAFTVQPRVLGQLLTGDLNGAFQELLKGGNAVVNIGADDEDFQEKVREIEETQFTVKDVSIDGRDEKWQLVEQQVTGFNFGDKSVVIEGNEVKWVQTKAEVEKWHPPLKTLSVGPPSASDLFTVEQYIERNIAPFVTVKVGTPSLPRDVLNPQRKAAGGILSAPTYALMGEAGPEAVVPLDRPLSMVDESVRALSAIAQGKTAFARGGIAGAQSKSVVVESGAVQVTTAATSPNVVGSIVLDGIADALSAAV